MSIQTDPTYAPGRSGAEYDRLTRQAALFRPITERLFREAGIGPGQRVLDVGSGVGDVAFLAAELVGPAGEVVGVDVDGAVLETARARAELLELGNVSFVEGDVRTAELGDGFDAAVGRLVLLYLADPADALRAIAERVRPGGVLAFNELDMDSAARERSFPAGTLWDEVGKLVVDTFEGAGTHVRMGRQLHGSFVRAGLPAPAMREEALVGGGTDFGGYGWLAGVARSIAPLMEQLRFATAAELELDTLAARLRDDVLARGAVVWAPPLVGAYARRPESTI